MKIYLGRLVKCELSLLNFYKNINCHEWKIFGRSLNITHTILFTIVYILFLIKILFLSKVKLFSFQLEWQTITNETLSKVIFRRIHKTKREIL